MQCYRSSSDRNHPYTAAQPMPMLQTALNPTCKRPCCVDKILRIEITPMLPTPPKHTNPSRTHAGAGNEKRKYESECPYPTCSVQRLANRILPRSRRLNENHQVVIQTPMVSVWLNGPMLTVPRCPTCASTAGSKLPCSQPSESGQHPCTIRAPLCQISVVMRDIMRGSST